MKDRADHRLFRVIDSVSWLGIVAHTGFIPLFLWLGVPVLAAFNVLSVSAWVAAKLVNRRGRQGDAVWLLVVEVVAHALLAVYFLGWDSGFHYYFLPLVPFLFFNHHQRTPVIVAQVAVLFGLYVGLYWFTHRGGWQPGPAGGVEPWVLDALRVMNILVNFTALGMLGFFHRSGASETERELLRLAATDTLTGLYTRRRMEEALELARVRHRRSGKAFALALIDFDHFKRYNDEHGHACGDQVLRETADLCRRGLRGQDEIARWGGEEFLVLMPETDLAGGIAAMDKLRETVAARPVRFGEVVLEVRISAGVTQVDADEGIEACVRRADEALYQAKRDGRDRVVAARARAVG